MRQEADPVGVDGRYRIPQGALAVLGEVVGCVPWQLRDRSTIGKEVPTPGGDNQLPCLQIGCLGVAEIACLESLQSHLRGPQIQAGTMAIDAAGNVGQLNTQSALPIDQNAEAALAHPP